MTIDNIEQAYLEFQQDVALEAAALGESDESAFFTMYSALASENGDCVDLLYTPARSEGRGSYQIDGYAFDTERGVLYIAVCDFRSGSTLETLNSAHLDNLLQRARRFLELATDPTFADRFPSSSNEFEAGYQLNSQPAAVRRVRVVVFSNARLSTRRPPEPAPEIAGRPVVYNFLDFTRYLDILRSRSSPEPIEVDLVALNGSAVPCLPAYDKAEGYEAYLVALPGQLLAEIYGLYGARLLEQNVRTFLQARTKVNKGIIGTIKDAPEMFFAYNNGLTATASGIRKTVTADGIPAIEAIEDLQIVNGGQTTASILYARDRSGSDLSKVFVQMKLSVVRPELVEDIVPKISRYANSQNKVSEADFFASHKFHITMEQISRRLSAPPRPGATAGTRWFYERARGQYRDGRAYGTAAERRAFESRFPASQVIGKTDLAKYETTFACLPHIVCQGAQKCFLQFAEKIAADWLTSELSFNDDWFKAAVAKAMLFRWTDRMVGQSAWYRADRGYKSQTVAYSLAWLNSRIRRSGKAGINLPLIWNMQEVPEEICRVLEELAPEVSAAIRATPESVRNVGEYCKKQACWNVINHTEFSVDELPEALLLDIQEERASRKDARAVRQVDKGIELEALILSLMPHAQKLHDTANRLRLLTPASGNAIRKLMTGKFPLPPADQRALAGLFCRMSEEGLDPASLAGEGSSGAASAPTTIRLSSSAVKTVRI